MSTSTENDTHGQSQEPCTDFCSLPPEEIRERAALIRTELVPKIVQRSALPQGLAWEFVNEPGMQARLAEFVEFERRCCSGMTFDASPTTDGSRIRLTITGEGAEAIAALGQEASPSVNRGRLRRALKAGGLGVGVSAFVCCLVPIGVAAVAGAAVAAPLATLDQPLYIGIGGLIAAAGAWTYFERRERAACADGC